MAEQILLLKLLTIPVLIIKFISRTISVITYLPNYIFILAMDAIIFNINFQSSLLVYSLLWPFRFIALNLVTLLFCCQFFAIYHFLDVYDKAWYIQVLAVSLALGGLLFLMRKGYLRMIASFKPIKLKSPLEHLQVYSQFLIDIIGIILALINILLLSNAHKTFSYKFVPSHQHQPYPSHSFLNHIKKQIHSSLLYDLTFFYTKIFFKIFRWRYNHNVEFVEKEKDNILNLMVLLTVMFLQTLLDIIVVGLLGWICLIHWKQTFFKARLRIEEQKYKVAYEHFSFILLQIFLLLITFPCILLNSTRTITHICLLLQLDSSAQSKPFTPQTFIPHTIKHILHSLLKLPAYFSLAMIYLLRYKYNKLNWVQLPKMKNGAKPVQEYDVDMMYMKLFVEQSVDMMLVPLIIACTLINPLYCKWLRLIIDYNYDFQRIMIINYFVRSMAELFCWIPASILITLIISLYSPYHIFLIVKGYYYLIRNTITLEQYIKQQSLWKRYTLGLWKKLSTDLPYLPLYLISSASLMKLFDQQTTPIKVYQLFQKFIKMFYLYRVKSSPRAELYFEMFSKDLASGLIQTEGHKMRFWKFAHKCERHIIIVKVLQLIVPKRKYQNKLVQIVKQDHLSAISNEYWYRLNLTHKMLQIFIAFVIEIIVGLVGLFILAPLTLWRLPTFILVFNIHRSKRFFFKVLFTVYKLMVKDLFIIWLHLFAFILSPVTFLRFRYRTMFRYGKLGVEGLMKIQQKKNNYVYDVIILQTLKIYRITFRILFIYIIHMRKQAYKNSLKKNNLTFDFLKKSLIQGAKLPSFDELIHYSYTFESIKFGKLQTITEHYFRMSVIDLPFLIVAFIVLIIMPWRFFYVKKALKEMKEDESGRYQVVGVMRSVFKDYLCIVLNVVLLFSGVKTLKAIDLIKRNYRLNFFVGFLKYSFLKELLYQLKQAIFIYFSILLLIISFIMDWQHALQLYVSLHAFYKEYKQTEKTKEQNQKIYKNTVKEKKDLKILDQMGFSEYVTLCQFLDMKDLARLARVSKMNYMMLDRQEIWIEKWQNCFTHKYEQTVNGDTFRIRCIKAYQLQTLHLRPTKLTFNELSKQLFIYHIYQQKTNLPQAIKPYLPQNIQEKVFKNYEWTTHEGYGPENELPQEENEDEEFLRLTNQTRRQKVWLVEDWKFYFDYFFVRPIEYISSVLNNFYRVDSHRRKKQLVFALSIISFIPLWIFHFYLMVRSIFQISKWTGVLILLLLYSFVFTNLAYTRLVFLYRQNWVSLKPYDLYYDVKNAILSVLRFIRKKLIEAKNYYMNKVYTPVKTKVIEIWKFVVKWVKKVVNYIVGKVKFVAKTFVDKIAVPLYISCVKKLIIIKKFIVMIFSATKKAIILLVKFIKKIVQSFYSAVLLLLKNLNGLYFNILLQSRRVLMKFGVLGELVFTLFGLMLMFLPSIFCYLVYNERWYVIVSTVHTAILMVLGYKHLNRIKSMVN